MADIAVTRSPDNVAPLFEVKDERLCEGRWESEGGGALPHHALPHLPASASPLPQKDWDEVRDSTISHPRAWTASVLPNKQQSHYASSPASAPGAAAPAGAGDKPRRKSITERLAESFHDLKQKAHDLVTAHKAEK